MPTCKNVKLTKCQNVKQKTPNIKHIIKLSDMSKLPKCQNVKMPKCQNAKMQKCRNPKILKCKTANVSNCQDA